MSATPFRVLVLCTGNSARSQIGEALLATHGAQRSAGTVEAQSAGSMPAARVNPFAVETLAARGIAWDGRVPKTIEQVAGQHFDLVITVCDNARDACPFFPGAQVQVHWGLPDPADMTTSDEARHACALTFDALFERVQALLALPLETLSAAELVEHATRIHHERSQPVF